MSKIPLAVRMAQEIVDLWKENAQLQYLAERGKEYERRYNELLSESVAHGEKMMVNWIDLLTSDAIKIVPPEKRKPIGSHA